LRERDQAAIDQLLGGIAVKRELQIEATWIEIHEPACQAIRLNWLRGIGRVLDRTRQHPTATRHSRQGYEPLIVKFEIVPVNAWPTPV
jgi:hypothetical protein